MCVCASVCVYVHAHSLQHSCVCESSFHTRVSHCLLCLLVAVTPGYFCCRGTYPFSLPLPLALSLSPLLSFSPSLSRCPSIHAFSPSVQASKTNDVLCVCVCEHCLCVVWAYEWASSLCIYVMLSSLTHTHEAAGLG